MSREWGSPPRPPAVSIVVAAWNAQGTIARAVRSVLQQTLTDFEIIVIDDGSEDLTANVARQAGGGDPRLHVVRLARNRGAAAARNLGLDLARGRWLAILDADDYMTPERLARLESSARNSGADLVLDDLLRLAAEADAAPVPLLGLAPGMPARTLSLAEFALGNRYGAGRRSLGYLKPLIARSFLERHGLRYPDLRVGEDYMVVLEALALGAGAFLLPAAGYVYVERPGSASSAMRVSDFDALLAADSAFRTRHATRLSAVDRASLDLRRASYADARSFAVAAEFIKAGRWRSALLQLAQRPAAAVHGGEALSKRLRRLSSIGRPA